MVEHTLKPGTKVRSKVTTMFGTVKDGDVVTIVRPFAYWTGLYIVDAPRGRATLGEIEFDVLNENET